MLVPLTDPQNPYAAMMIELIVEHRIRNASNGTGRPTRRPMTRGPVARVRRTFGVIPAKLRLRWGTA
jgi:hypothetical protein